MGYSDFGNFKLVDGYALNGTTDGYSFTSNWVDIHSAPFFDVTAVFTGGSPAGTLTLNKSNNLQWTGGNRPKPLFQGNVGAVSDVTTPDTGNGVISVSVSGAGVYSLSQHLIGYRWFQVVYTSSISTSGANTQLDVFVNWKK